MSVTLHGPDRPFYVTDIYGDPKRPKRRSRLVGALAFDLTIYQPMTFPTPIPDYSPDEAARLVAAEVKRADKAGDFVPDHATESTLPSIYFSPGTVTIRGEEVGSPWAIAYWRGWSFRFERAGLGAPWSRVNTLWGN